MRLAKALPNMLGLTLAAMAAEPLVNGGFEDLLLPERPFFRESFSVGTKTPLFRKTYGDAVEPVFNGVIDGGEGDDGRVGRLRFRWTERTKNMTYWSYALEPQVSIIPQLERVSFRVRATVPVSIKVGIAPYGFIYHGPQEPPTSRRDHGPE